MKKLAFLLTIIVIMTCFSIKSHAVDDVDALVGEFENILPDGYGEKISDPELFGDAIGVGAVVAEIVALITKSRGEVLSFFLTLVGALVLMGCVSGISGKLSGAVCAAVGSIASLLVFFPLVRVYGAVSESLTAANSFFMSLIPITAGITALGGGSLSAETQGTGMMITSSAIAYFCSAVFTSLSGMGLAMSLISSFGGDGLISVSRSIKTLFTRLLGISAAVIGGTLSLQTIVASARDSAAIRAARYAASGMIPVVGSTVSGALSTLATGLSYAKGIVGGGAIFVIVSILSSPFIIILLYRAALSFSVTLADFFGIASAKRILEAFLFSVDSVMCAYTLSAIMYVFEIVLFIKGGVVLS